MLVVYVLTADWIKVAFGKSQMIYRIQNVCFANTIGSNETIDLMIELKFTTFKILIVNQA